MKVGDVYEKIATHCDYYSKPIAWGHTRTILNAMDRECVAYGISHRSAVIIFPKKGGYLAYSLCLKERWYNSYYKRHTGTITATNEEFQDALAEIHDIKKKNMGVTYIEEGLEDELYKRAIIEAL